MRPETQAKLDALARHLADMTPEQLAEHKRKQQESFVRSMQLVDEPCAERIAEYEANKHNMPEAWHWRGEGPPPPRWTAGNTIIYRTYADAVDD